MSSPIDHWHSLLTNSHETTAAFWNEFSADMRRRKLTFGGRLNCPFLRPCFIDAADETRVARVAETIAAVGERLVREAVRDGGLLSQLRLSEAEERLVAIESGYERASTASRLDAFLLPDSLKFAEYNAESPAGLAYSHGVGELFLTLGLTTRFRERFDVVNHPLPERMLEALLASYREWGGRAAPPTIAIVDFREVPTWTEFEILQAAFAERGVPTVVCDPRDLEYDGRRLRAQGREIDLVYRRVLINDIVARPDDCRALVDAYRDRAVCVANTFRCKIPHKKAFFAVLTDDRNAQLFSPEERRVIADHVPWTRVVADVPSTRHGEPIQLLEYVRRHRESLVLKPSDEYGGSGVTLGWETSEADWERTLAGAIADPQKVWIVQERIPIRRELFPIVREPHAVEMRDMLVDFASYLFRGKLAGYLTRLSSTGLANVTSGGGQVPVFVVRERSV